ncbi:Polygalacturonase [Clostridium sp. USBA 49]|uniref:glycoside hydrolase family 28 protein n=1 Tax=Clostridium sp. USBA 49 TaxID=1881060 RepID=UPI000999F087|nr:glycoside hydrolase family 28 protein [Clostridium sp. USBA 49]SKA73691.1 Polygalacturonase [Clostridium sp. USBA 49]
MIKFSIISITSRSISFEIENDKYFYTENNINIYLNNNKIDEINTNVFTIKNLNPMSEYSILLEDSKTKETSEKIIVRTKDETSLINVKNVGAKGNGKVIDTAYIQAAIEICPKNGRIFFPKGKYLTGPIFLKSNITLEFDKDAILLGLDKREKYPILPGLLKSNLDDKDYYIASWEGEAADSFASLITGINVDNVNIIGEGTIDGNANFNTWWYKAKTKKIAWRPRTLFLNGCKNILVEGITIKNSPSWTIHPLMCEGLKFINLNIKNPKEAPNTDGLDPESCKDVLILGTKFSVGDDCIAIKSGKFSISKKYSIPSENIYIRNCIMEYGHGAVVIGSEMSCGVKNVFIEKCIFNSTDRGIRIKTRRGRGSKGIIDEIYASKIKMNKVLTPFTINCFYFCDIDGKTEYVWSKEKLPIDERTPYVGNIYFKDINCENAEVAAGFIYGLPEKKIESVNLENVHVHFSENAKPNYAEMLSFIEPMCKNGFYFNNIKHLKLKNVTLENEATEPFIKDNIDTQEIIKGE